MNKFVRRGLLLLVCLLVLQLVVGGSTVLADGYHVVRTGETLFSIGRLYGVNPYYIGQVNGLPNPNYVQIGQVLYIPYGGPAYLTYPRPVCRCYWCCTYYYPCGPYYWW
jgi:hypothetical protein